MGGPGGGLGLSEGSVSVNTLFIPAALRATCLPPHGGVLFPPGKVADQPITTCVFRREYDQAIDGVLDLITVVGIGRDGKRLWIEHDTDADGLVDDVTRFVYDEYGREWLVAWDEGNDGRASYWRYSAYDSDGHLVRWMFDDDADGTVDSVYTWTYDGAGVLCCYAEDSDADGVAEWEEHYSYDEAGRMVRMVGYSNGAHTASVIVLYTYIGDLLVRVEWDDGADGSVDSWYVYVYDAESRLSRWEQWEPGRLVSYYELHYDSAGRLARHDVYMDNAWQESYLYSYDQPGRLTEERYSSHAHPPWTKVYTYGLDCPADLNRP